MVISEPVVQETISCLGKIDHTETDQRLVIIQRLLAKIKEDASDEILPRALKAALTDLHKKLGEIQADAEALEVLQIIGKLFPSTNIDIPDDRFVIVSWYNAFPHYYGKAREGGESEILC